MKSFKVAASAILLSSASALAADLPSIKSAPIASSTPIWTGFYAGLNAGGAWQNTNVVNTTNWNVQPGNQISDIASAALLSGSILQSGSLGFIGGGQIGYNWARNFYDVNLVLGIEADIQGAAGADNYGSRFTAGPIGSLKRGRFYLDAFDTTLQNTNSTLNYLGTFRGRVGFEILPNLLAYGTAGLAYGGISSDIRAASIETFSTNITGFPRGPVDLVYGYKSNYNFKTGWTAGGGMEWAVLPKWSIKGEYLYYDMGNVAGTLNTLELPLISAVSSGGFQSLTNYSSRYSGNIIRLGVNYHFNLSPSP